MLVFFAIKVKTYNLLEEEVYEEKLCYSLKMVSLIYIKVINDLISVIYEIVKLWDYKRNGHFVM